MFVLDTNVVSELMKSVADDRVTNWLAGVGNVRVMTTAVTVAEIEFGLQRLPAGRRKEDYQKRFEGLMTALPVLPLDDVAALRAGQFQALREKIGAPTKQPDMMIAGIVATIGAGLVTRNDRDFANLPLAVINPWTTS